MINSEIWNGIFIVSIAYTNFVRRVCLFRNINGHKHVRLVHFQISTRIAYKWHSTILILAKQTNCYVPADQLHFLETNKDKNIYSEQHNTRLL